MLECRLAWQPSNPIHNCALLYELIALHHNGRLAAVRDHTAVVALDAPTPQAVVHLSHVLVEPEFRRTGLAGWLRALPIQAARACLVAAGHSPTSPITLVAEMEHPDAAHAGRMIRLQAYERAGFQKLDPAVTPYCQPDFRPVTEIDASGGPRPLPFALVTRRVGREHETEITGAEARALADALYRMYGTAFREQDMVPLWRNLAKFPAPEATISLTPPTA